jgi:flagellar motor switch/type III secretory pathway protein FliN
MGALRKHINELLAVKKMAADEVWINNKALDSIEYRFATGTNNEQWFIEISPDKSAAQINNQPCVCIEGKSSIWIDNGFTFLGNLTGIFLDERQREILNLLAGKIPAPLKTLFDAKVISLSTPPAEAYGLLIRYGTHDVCYQTTLWMHTQDWINFLSNNCFTYKAIENPATSMNWEIPIHVGSINIALTECSKLEAGDLLFLDKTLFNNHGSGIINFAKMRADVILEEHDNNYQLTIQQWDTSIMNTEEYAAETEELIEDDMTMSADEEMDSSSSRLVKAPIADVPLKLNVKLGSIQFTLEDLGRMVEGKVYPIDSICPGKVQLMANGIEVARGQLVDVEGRLAVEIQRRWIQA